MAITTRLLIGAIVVTASTMGLSQRGAEAQSETNLNVLRGLALLGTLDQTDAGNAGLTKDFAVTVAIQNGARAGRSATVSQSTGTVSPRRDDNRRQRLSACRWSRQELVMFITP